MHRACRYAVCNFTFLHRWEEIKGADAFRSADVMFPHGYHIRLRTKDGKPDMTRSRLRPSLLEDVIAKEVDLVAYVLNSYLVMVLS